MHNEDFKGCTGGWSWDCDTKTRAQGILALLRNFEFSVCIIALKNILLPLRGITSKLQKRDLDIYEAFCDIDSVIEDFKTIRSTIDERYESWYEEILQITKSVGGEEKQSQIVGRQQHRSNQPVKCTKEYYKIAIVVPFCDEVVMQLNNHFSEDSKLSIRGLLRLAPPLLVKCEDGNLKTVVNDLKLYEAELPRFESLYIFGSTTLER